MGPDGIVLQAQKNLTKLHTLIKLIFKAQPGKDSEDDTKD